MPKSSGVYNENSFADIALIFYFLVISIHSLMFLICCALGSQQVTADNNFLLSVSKI